MKILLLCHAFNSLAQRLHVALREAGHAVSVELDIADAVTEEAVSMFDPDLMIAPFLKRRIPESVWSRRLCLVVHPGPPGDGGPNALDWAIERGLAVWGVTVLQAVHEYDAGPVWAWRTFDLRPGATKGSLYRHEVTTAALAAVMEALSRWRPGVSGPVPPPALPEHPGQWQRAMTPDDRCIDWAHDDTATALRRLQAADGAPGVPDTLDGAHVRWFDAHPASADDLASAPAGTPGAFVARRGPALLRLTRDGGVWLGHARVGRGSALTREAVAAFPERAAALPDLPVPLQRNAATWDELSYRESGVPGARVGWLRFAFHNGAMSWRQCNRLREALEEVSARDTQVLVLEGGDDFFCHGIHLHAIEAVAQDGGSGADASMLNIEAIDDVALAILQREDRLTVAALHGNAGAGGVFLALAADLVWAHGGVVLNPHYRNMGNLYGSEYWTYLLPRRCGPEAARRIMRGRLPMGADEARRLGLVDAVLAPDAGAFGPALQVAVETLAGADDLPDRIADKAARRATDEAERPLSAYRADELAAMRLNFYGFDPSFHVARHHFVHRKLHAWTPRHLAVHRDRPG